MAEIAEVFTPKQVAELLGTHVGVIRKWIREKRLGARRVGDQYIITAEDIGKFQRDPDRRPSRGKPRKKGEA